MFQPSEERSRLRRIIADALSATSIGEILTYERIHAITGRSAPDIRSITHEAMVDCNKENGAVFGNIRNVGYQRLTQEQTPEVGSTARRSIVRKARKATRLLKNYISRTNGLPKEIASEVNREIALGGLIEFSASGKAMNAVRKLGDVAEAPPSPSEIGAALIARYNKE